MADASSYIRTPASLMPGKSASDRIRARKTITNISQPPGLLSPASGRLECGSPLALTHNAPCQPKLQAEVRPTLTVGVDSQETGALRTTARFRSAADEVRDRLPRTCPEWRWRWAAAAGSRR